AEDNQETQHTYFYQLIMEKDERLVLPTTQQLFELSFLQIGIKLKEVPSCLIIQMPRFGKDYKMYKRILPSLELDITDVLENAPRECIICGDLAAFECKECYQVHGAGLNTIAFCDGCKKTSHQHKLRVNHRCRKISVPPAYRDLYLSRKVSEGRPIPIPREKMELFAVICIQTSHYVSFVKTGKGRDAKWIFFDSMADRMGEQSGYNIPEVRECSEIPRWLSDECYNDIMKYPEDKTLPEHMRRLICDAYICMYQSPQVMMFK
ncbi:ubiquitin carboxyl-terminal hydrolase CYLD-like, partial [Mercenaria mercenaria]|uniref:ubiquitin carboxyl-terminal hydrolase CYLD-like n=1 Tax=Mercenaria mercenaria TaxID=6596 RepID=UPI00234E5DE1